MADLAALQVSLDLQTAAFERGMASANASMARLEGNAKKTSGAMGSLANGFKTLVAGAGIAALANMAKSLIDAADKAQDLADAFGTTVDRIYLFNQAMVEAGGKSDAMGTAMQKLADQVDSAFEGTDAAVDAFQRLGISMDSMKNQNLDQIFNRVTQALEKETDEVKRNAIAKDLLGKSMIGVNYETFNNAVENSAEQFKNLAPLLKEAADFSDNLAKQWTKFTTYLTAGVGALVQTVGKIAQGFKDIYAVISGEKSIAQAMEPMVVAAEKAAPAMERVAKATAAQTKAATEAAKEMEAWNKEIAKQVEQQIQWETSLLDSINPMREIDRELAKLQVALDSGRISWDQYADAMFKITDGVKSLEAVKGPLDEIGVAIGVSLQQGVAGLVDTFFEAKKSFGEFAADFLKQIAKMIAQTAILNALKKSSFGGFFGFATGGAFNGSTGLPQGVYNSPTFFPMPSGGLRKFANGGVPGMGVLAEAGRSEAIVPLVRHGNDLGVKASPVNINVINNTNSQVDVASSESQDGTRTIDVLITQKVREAFGNGTMDSTMRAAYGLSRRGM